MRENRGRNDGLKNPVGDPQSGWGGGGADSGEVWVELCRRGLQTLTLFKTKIAHFATMLSGGSGGGARGTRPPLSLDQIKNSNNISRLDMIALFKAYRVLYGDL